MGHYDNCYSDDYTRVLKKIDEQNKNAIRCINQAIEKIEDKFSDLNLNTDGEEVIRAATYKLVELKALIKYATEI
jgi:predicted PolB exonuclease-like 3'-5' exonuclease